MVDSSLTLQKLEIDDWVNFRFNKCCMVGMELVQDLQRWLGRERGEREREDHSNKKSNIWLGQRRRDNRQLDFEERIRVPK